MSQYNLLTTIPIPAFTAGTKPDDYLEYFNEILEQLKLILSDIDALAEGDSTAKESLDSKFLELSNNFNNFIAKSGLTQNLNANEKLITDLADPLTEQDAVNLRFLIQ